VEVPNLVGILLCLIKAKFLLLFARKCICYYVALMVVPLLLFICLYAGYKHGYMIVLSHGSIHVFACN